MLGVNEMTRVVLPIGEADVEELSASPDIESWSTMATKHELASVLLILMMQRLSKARGQKSALVEQTLAELLASTKSASELDALKNKLLTAWDHDAFQTGLALLQENGIALMQASDEELHNQILEQDNWDFEISKTIMERRDPFKHRIDSLNGGIRTLTEPQYRIALKVVGEIDEDLDLQGYAGVGKTHLIEVFLSILEDNGLKPLLLSFTKQQLNALKTRLGRTDANGMTFGELATAMLVESGKFARSDLYERSASTYQISNKQLADSLQIQSVGKLDSTTVTDIARRTISSYCMSVDDNIEDHHLPKLVDRLTASERGELLAASTLLWRETITPTRTEVKPPIRGYHQIKQVSLMSEVVPTQFSHVIVDESHELTGPLLAILDRSPAATITMGDKFQHLGGYAAARSQTVRRNSIHLSVRAGSQFEDVANPILEKHPGWNDLPFMGSALRRTEVIHYDRPALPDIPIAILCGTEWHLIEWFQRLSHQDARFCILPGSYHSFKGLMEGCINLYHHEIRSQHPFLFRYPSWQEMASSQGNNDAFRRIERMLGQGYGMEDLERSLGRLQHPASAKITLGLVEHSKNMEFNAVMITPEVLNSSSKLTKKSGAKILANLYTGASRAKHALYIPGNLKDWLQDITLTPDRK